MKITILDFDDIRNPLLAGGQAVSTFEIGTILAKKGHHITVITSRYPGYRDRNERGIHYRHIGLGTANIRLNNLFYILSIPWAVKNLKTDVILECFTAPISTLFSPLFTSAPVLAKPTSFQADNFSKKYHLPFYLIEKFGVRFYRYFIPYSYNLDQKMKRLNPGIISKLVTEGVSEDYFKIKRGKPEFILYLGRLDIHQKGIDLLLNAYKKIAAKIPYPLLIAGHGPDEIRIKKQIIAMNLGNKVKLVGPAYEDKKKEYMSGALFITLPSRYEGFCIFALEAMAAGIPVVCFDIPGLSWIDKKCAVKVKSYDIDGYAQALLDLSAGKKGQSVGKCAKEFARQFTWEKVAGQYENFFKQILKQTK